MALIDRVPGDLDLYIGGYVTMDPRVEMPDTCLCDYRFEAD